MLSVEGNNLFRQIFLPKEEDFKPLANKEQKENLQNQTQVLRRFRDGGIAVIRPEVGDLIEKFGGKPFEFAEELLPPGLSSEEINSRNSVKIPKTKEELEENINQIKANLGKANLGPENSLSANFNRSQELRKQIFSAKLDDQVTLELARQLQPILENIQNGYKTTITTLESRISSDRITMLENTKIGGDYKGLTNNEIKLIDQIHRYEEVKTELSGLDSVINKSAS